MTLLNLVNNIISSALAHPQIKFAEYVNDEEIELNQDSVFPYLAIYHDSISVNDNMNGRGYSLKLSLITKLKQDVSDRLQIHSDNIEILNDLILSFNSDFTVESISMTPIYVDFDTICAGIQASFTVYEVRNEDPCIRPNNI